MVLENSNSNVSRVSRPVIYVGNKGFSVFVLAWIVRIAPINTDISSTIGSEIKVWRDLVGDTSEEALDRDAEGALRFVRHVFGI